MKMRNKVGEAVRDAMEANQRVCCDTMWRLQRGAKLSYQRLKGPTHQIYILSKGDALNGKTNAVCPDQLGPISWALLVSWCSWFAGLVQAQHGVNSKSIPPLYFSPPYSPFLSFFLFFLIITKYSI